MDKQRILEASTYQNYVNNETGIGFVIRTKDDYCECFYNKSYSSITIIIKGSDSPKDFFGKRGNLHYFDYNDDGIHDGFQNSYDKLEEKIFEFISRIFNNIRSKICSVKSFNVIGYSRGAAIGTILLKSLAECFWKSFTYNGILFGSPPVGDIDFKDRYCEYGNINLLRIVNGYDLVATSRLYKMVDLVHVGRELVLPKKFWHRLPHLRIKDHMFHRYIESIHKL